MCPACLTTTAQNLVAAMRTCPIRPFRWTGRVDRLTQPTAAA